MNINEKQYYAGVFDCDLRFRERGNGYVEMFVHTRTKALAEDLRDRFGGSVYANGPNSWRWSLGDRKKIVAALEQITDHLRHRRKEAFAVWAALTPHVPEIGGIAQKRTAR